LPGVDIIHVRPVQFAFKVELPNVIDDHGEAVTIEVVVLEANEAVVLEANEAVVLEANEAVVFEANEAVVFEDRTHCRLVQRCGRETEGSSRTGFGR
jgi:hypothetical protein